jgi:hypothetical protein
VKADTYRWRRRRRFNFGPVVILKKPLEETEEKKGRRRKRRRKKKRRRSNVRVVLVLNTPPCLVQTQHRLRNLLVPRQHELPQVGTDG